MTQIILYSAIAGIAGMGLGGLVSAILLKKPSDNMTCWLLSFASGVMVSIVAFGLLPEAVEISGVWASLFGIVIGIAVVMGLNRVVDKITGKKGDASELHPTYEALYHQSPIINRQKGLNPQKMLRSGILMLVAIALHNVPEGMAIGAGGVHDINLGLMLAIVIAVHNLPEGMAIAAPLLAGGVGKLKVVLLTALAGSTTLVGGIIGVLIGSISDFAIALSLAGAGGAMLYIVFGEIIPQSSIMANNRTASIITLLGIVVGMVAAEII